MQGRRELPKRVRAVREMHHLRTCCEAINCCYYYFLRQEDELDDSWPWAPLVWRQNLIRQDRALPLIKSDPIIGCYGK